MENGESLRIKQPKTYDEQIQIFKNRNLIIEDEQFAKNILSEINYYRLSAYSLTLKTDDIFHEDVTFNHIFNLYEFDRKLRLQLISLLEKIEISFRAKISYYLAHEYGAAAHFNKDNFKNEEYFIDMTRQIDSEINRSKEIFITHHKDKYESIFPVWVIIEVISFSLLSKIYSNLKDEDQTNIASLYSNNRFYIRNWMYALSTVRNICAHFGRFYNRHLPIHFKISKNDSEKINYGNTTFCSIFIMGKIIEDKQLFNSVIINIAALIEGYTDVNITQLGFPENWEEILRNI